MVDLFVDENGLAELVTRSPHKIPILFLKTSWALSHITTAVAMVPSTPAPAYAAIARYNAINVYAEVHDSK